MEFSIEQSWVGLGNVNEIPHNNAVSFKTFSYNVNCFSSVYAK